MSDWQSFLDAQVNVIPVTFIVTIRRWMQKHSSGNVCETMQLWLSARANAISNTHDNKVCIGKLDDLSQKISSNTTSQVLLGDEVISSMRDRRIAHWQNTTIRLTTDPFRTQIRVDQPLCLAYPSCKSKTSIQKFLLQVHNTIIHEKLLYPLPVSYTGFACQGLQYWHWNTAKDWSTLSIGKIILLQHMASIWHT